MEMTARIYRIELDKLRIKGARINLPGCMKLLRMLLGMERAPWIPPHSHCCGWCCPCCCCCCCTRLDGLWRAMIGFSRSAPEDDQICVSTVEILPCLSARCPSAADADSACGSSDDAAGCCCCCCSSPQHWRNSHSPSRRIVVDGRIMRDRACPNRRDVRARHVVRSFVTWCAPISGLYSSCFHDRFINV